MARPKRAGRSRYVQELSFPGGGPTYEMAIREHYRLDVLSRKAAELQAVDAELGEVQRVLAAQEDGVTGTCRSCGAVHSRGAVFCWQCGQPLLREALAPGDQAEAQR